MRDGHGFPPFQFSVRSRRPGRKAHRAVVRLRQGRRADGRPGHRHCPRGGGHRTDPGARRFGLRHPRGGMRMPTSRGQLLAGTDQKHRGSSGDRRDTRGRVDSGATSGRGPRSRHWRLDLRRRGRRNRLHGFRVHHRWGHLTVDRAPRQRRPLPRRLFTVWRYHPFFTDSTEPLTAADTTHRRHGIIETVFADLIDGPLGTCHPASLAPTPPGSCVGPSRTTCCARCGPRRHPAPHDHRNPGTAGPPATTTRPASTQQLAIGTGMDSSLAQHNQQSPAHNSLTPPDTPTRPDPNRNRKSWADQGPNHAHTGSEHDQQINPLAPRTASVDSGLGLWYLPSAAVRFRGGR